MAGIHDLRLKLSELYRDLKFAYEGNKPEYLDLQKNITDLTSELNAAVKAEEEKKKLEGVPSVEYDPKLGVYVPSGKAAENEERLKRLHDGRPTDEDLAWRNQCLLEPISGTEWYNNLQVEALTGQQVPVGTSALSDFLQKNRNPGAFAYIIEGPNEQNHFVSFDIRTGADGRFEITYVDSNGDLMPEAERAVLARQYPGVEVKYIDRDGNKISEAEATPQNLLRVQFDGHNCGMYSSEITQMLNESKGASLNVDRLKEISSNPDMQRQVHAGKLSAIAAGRQHEPSEAVGSASKADGLEDDRSRAAVIEHKRAAAQQHRS